MILVRPCTKYGTDMSATFKSFLSLSIPSEDILTRLEPLMEALTGISLRVLKCLRNFPRRTQTENKIFVA